MVVDYNLISNIQEVLLKYDHRAVVTQRCKGRGYFIHRTVALFYIVLSV